MADRRPGANDNAHPLGIAMRLSPLACRSCRMVGTILDTAIECDEDGKPLGDMVCGQCGSADLDFDPPPLATDNCDSRNDPT